MPGEPIGHADHDELVILSPPGFTIRSTMASTPSTPSASTAAGSAPDRIIRLSLSGSRMCLSTWPGVMPRAWAGDQRQRDTSSRRMFSSPG